MSRKPIRTDIDPEFTFTTEDEQKTLELQEKRKGFLEYSREISTKARDIGRVPNIADVARREACRTSLVKFCTTYNPDAFYMQWSPDQIRAAQRIEECVINGAMYAFAEPRGNGKTTRVRMAALWAVSYWYRRYVFIIGANAAKAEESLSAIKMYIRFLPIYSQDFPEICYPIQQLQGIAMRARGQTSLTESTLCEWSSLSITLPRVAPPDNWPDYWPVRSDGYVLSSSAVIGASGLSGEGIRGSLTTISTGESVRPDFVMLDDPQTQESAKSPTSNAYRTKLISADVLGMAGPAKKISAVMPCTVICKDDMVDRLLDRNKHPLWRGERTSMLKTMPTNMMEWDQYFELYSRCAVKEPPDFSESNAYYIRNREILDAGAEATWEARRLDDEISAIQHAMHLYYRDPDSFWAEYQNKPKSILDELTDVLDADLLMKRGTNLPPLFVPRECTRLVAFIDTKQSIIWHTVCAFDEKFGGSIVRYGPYPDQSRSYFSCADARPTLSEVPEFRNQPLEAAIYGGLEEVTRRILSTPYRIEGLTTEMHVSCCLVDANWGTATDLIYEFCRRSKYANIIIPSHGKYYGAASPPMASYNLKAGETEGDGWRISAQTTPRGRHIVYDTNHWKTFTAARLKTAPGAPGCMRIFNPGIHTHKLWADHLTAEFPVEVTARGRKIAEWKNLPQRDNDLWDCLVGCFVAVSTLGLKWSSGSAAGAPPEIKKAIERIKWSDYQKNKARKDAKY